MEQLSLHITETARAHIAMLMRGKESGSMPAILFASRRREFDANGSLVREVGPHWYLGVYSKAQIERLADDYAANGYPLVYSVQELAVCVPQSQLVAELAGKTLDVSEYNVSIR